MRDDVPSEPDCLAACRHRLDRVTREAAAELGPRPMIPEKFSMLAMMLASVPLMALLHLDPAHRLPAFEMGIVLSAVWHGALQFQRVRYDRFEARWESAVRAHLAQPEPCEAPRSLIFRRAEPEP